MTIRHDEQGGRYVGRVPGGKEAALDYSTPEAGVIELKRTFVPESQRGRGLGRRLVQHVLDEALSQGLKVIPTCPFVGRVLSDAPEYQELVVGERQRA